MMSAASLSDEFIFDGIVSVDEDGSVFAVGAQPNPFTDVLTVTVPQGLDRVIQVVDLQGGIAMSQSVANGVQEVELSARDLATGVYVVRVTSATSQWSTTVVKR